MVSQVNSGVKGLRMLLSDFYKVIEGADFQSRFMILSGFSLVRNALSRHPSVQKLISEIRLCPLHIDNVGKRILLLCSENKDRPGATYDIAIAAYLYCLYHSDQYFAKRMSEYVLQLGKLWWATDLALHIKKNMELFGDSSNWQLKFYEHATQTDDLDWNLRDKTKRLTDNVQAIVNGEGLCDTSGQYSVNSPLKIRSPEHSVSLT